MTYPDIIMSSPSFMGGLCVRRLWVTGTNLGQLKHNELRTCALLAPNVRLALVWCSSGVYIHTWKTLTFLSTQKMCAEFDAHKKWMIFLRRSRQIINEFRRTPSESLRATTHWPKFFIFLCAGWRDGMCDWAFTCLLMLFFSRKFVQA